jgi:hypothetical protein
LLARLSAVLRHKDATLLALATLVNATQIEIILIEQCILDTSAGKQLSKAATDV